MSVPVRVGQVWRDPYAQHTDELRLVRIDGIEERVERQTVLGMTREIRYPIARISSKLGNGEFKPVTRFIRIKRFEKFYKLYKDV